MEPKIVTSRWNHALVYQDSATHYYFPDGTLHSYILMEPHLFISRCNLLLIYPVETTNCYIQKEPCTHIS